MHQRRAIQQLDLNLLKVLRALYHEQNMSKAADTLNITPSAVSHAVRRLRAALNDPLFERSQNKMLPTATCRRMAPEIIDTLASLQQLLQNWGEFDPQTSEHAFRIGMHDALEPSILPRLAEVLAQRAPRVTFSSIKLERQALATDLAAGELDVALDIALQTNDAVNSLKLVVNDFVVLMRKHHPLANILNKRSYLQADHLVVSSRPSGMSAEDAQLSNLGLARLTSLRCQNYYAAREMVRGSDRLLTLSRPLAEEFRDADFLISEIPFKLPGFATQMYWHENFTHDPALIWLRDTVRSLFNT